MLPEDIKSVPVDIARVLGEWIIVLAGVRGVRERLQYFVTVDLVSFAENFGGFVSVNI